MTVKLAQVIGGCETNLGMIVQVLGPHPVAKCYRNREGSIVQCKMWQVDPPISGFNGGLYDAVPDNHLRMLDA